MALIWSGLLIAGLLFGASPASAELQIGDTLDTTNWQEAEGLMPEAILRRFRLGSAYRKPHRDSHRRAGVGQPFSGTDRGQRRQVCHRRQGGHGRNRNRDMAALYRRRFPFPCNRPGRPAYRQQDHVQYGAGRRPS